MAIAVPNAPLRNPAVVSARGVGRGCQVITDSTTKASTPSPITMKNALRGRASTTYTPITVPGSLPSIAQPTPRQSTWACSRATVRTVCAEDTSSIGAGTSEGSTNASAGTATSASPKPTTP